MERSTTSCQTRTRDRIDAAQRVLPGLAGAPRPRVACLLAEDRLLAAPAAQDQQLAGRWVHLHSRKTRIEEDTFLAGARLLGTPSTASAATFEFESGVAQCMS